MVAKQLLGPKKTRECAKILGMRVLAAFANGYDLPHNCCLAWVSRNDAYIVNLKHKYAVQYIAFNDYVLRRCKVILHFNDDTVGTQPRPSWESVT